jgi:hypothetical protein
VSGWSLIGIAVLGAFHGLNPAMGWLLAVGAGLQRGSRRALALALPPIALGHLASVGLALLVAGGLQTVVSDRVVRVGAVAALAVFAWWRLAVPHGHGRPWAMSMAGHELALWSFLMSTAHGAGVMLLPFAVAGHVHVHVHTAATAALLHTAMMVLVTTATAVFVYEVVGVGFLRRGWINVDRVWAYALGAGAAATLFLT